MEHCLLCIHAIPPISNSLLHIIQKVKQKTKERERECVFVCVWGGGGGGERERESQRRGEEESLANSDSDMLCDSLSVNCDVSGNRALMLKIIHLSTPL